MAYAETEVFSRAYAYAKDSAVLEFGRRWWMNPSACLGRATFPPLVCASVKVSGTTIKSPNTGWLPAARFWPDGAVPYAAKMKVTPLDLSGQGETVKPPENDRHAHVTWLEYAP